MKTLLALVSALACFVQVSGNILPSLPMGSERAVLNYCLRSGDYLIIYIYQYNKVTGLRQPSYVKEILIGKYQSKEALEKNFRLTLKETIERMIAGNFGQRSRDMFEFYVSYGATADMEIYLNNTGTFFLGENLGVFTCPDLSHFKIGFPSTIPYKLNASWIRAETYDKVRTTTRVDDSKNGSEFIEELYSDMYRIQIPTEQAIGAGAGYEIRVSAFVNQRFVIYHNGIRVREKEPELKLEFYPSKLSINAKINLLATGGEVGRTYQLLSSTNFMSWNNTKLKYIVAPDSTGTNFIVEPIDGVSYRLRSVEIAPEY